MFRPAKVKAETKAVAEQVKLAEAPLNVAPLIPYRPRGGIRLTSPVTKAICDALGIDYNSLSNLPAPVDKAYVDALGIDHSSLANLLVDTHTQYVPVDGVARQLADAGYPNALLLSGVRAMTGDFLPATTNLYNVGITSKRWLSAWMGTLNVTVGVGLSLIPITDNIRNLGSSAKRWAYAYITNIVADAFYVDAIREKTLDHGVAIEQEQAFIIANLTGSLPTANAANNGKMFRVADIGTTADILYCCMKSAADTYSWVQIASG